MNTDSILDAKWKKTEQRIDLGFVGLILLIVAVVAVISSSSFRANSSQVIPKSVAKFSGSVVHISLINPHSVDVKFLIKNNSHNSGTPNCTLMIQDPSGAFPGFYAPVILHAILGGHSSSSTMTMTVAGPGPQYVTQGKIHCV